MGAGGAKTPSHKAMTWGESEGKRAGHVQHVHVLLCSAWALHVCSACACACHVHVHDNVHVG